MKEMRCPKCVEAGLKSRVFVGAVEMTTMWCQPFYDEDGKYHHHDSGTRSQRYSCSNGHHWCEQSRPSCWCGWPEKGGGE